MRGTLPGSGIAYEVDGDGPPLLLLHAFPLGLAMWEHQSDDLANSVQVIRFDDRGFGSSPPGSGPLTMDQIADDAAALLDLLGHEKALVGGSSMGGYASLAFARRHGARLAGLILVGTRAGADSEEGRKRRSHLASRALEDGARPVVEAFLPGLVGETSHKERPDLVASVDQAIMRTAPRGLANALLGMGAREDSTPSLKEISVPTLVVCGLEDTLTPPAESEALQRGIRGSRLELIERAGHLPGLENPGAFNAVVRAFLGTVFPEGPRRGVL
jgi:pimeloyl-ACP methyl ester carboxylesterase